MISCAEAELGKPIDELFESFDVVPIAGASLGQVHTATTKAGMRVAVKVQRSGLKELFDTDLKNLKKLAELLDKVTARCQFGLEGGGGGGGGPNRRGPNFCFFCN